jgi:3-phosphoshikimate 1-carboxyvinyltransferase
MHKEIWPFFYNGSIKIHSSKSYFQRAIAFSCLSNSNCIIHGDSNSDDIQVALKICSEIGFKVVLRDHYVVLNKITDFKSKSISVNIGESGLCARMFGVILSSIFENTEILGEGTARLRKINLSFLKQLGVKITSNNNFLPIIINGKLKSGIINIDGSEGSQLLSGLLIALPFLKEDSVINVSNLVSKPYVDMTISLLKEFGIKIINNNYKSFLIQGGQTSKVSKYNVEGDWSGAAFHLVGAAISGFVSVKGLNINSLQADRAIIEALELCGAIIKLENNVVVVRKNNLNAFSFDATECPDLFPPIVALASCCNGRTVISGVKRLKNKESNRAYTLKKEFAKLGVVINIEGNKMIIEGGSLILGGNVDSHKDHRIAMALSVMACVSDMPISIQNYEAVSKSYSKFYSDLSNVSS